jgi:hypothetical protein
MRFAGVMGSSFGRKTSFERFDRRWRRRYGRSPLDEHTDTNTFGMSSSVIGIEIDSCVEVRRNAR